MFEKYLTENYDELLKEFRRMYPGSEAQEMETWAFFKWRNTNDGC